MQCDRLLPALASFTPSHPWGDGLTVSNCEFKYTLARLFSPSSQMEGKVMWQGVCAAEIQAACWFSSTRDMAS